MTGHSIEEYLRRKKLETGFEPDLIVLDYIERMDAFHKVDRRAEWVFLQQVARELIQVAKRMKLVIWTAAQVNRAGLNTKMQLTMEHAQGSIRHLQEAACLVAVRKIVVEKTRAGDTDVRCLEFRELKQRHADMADRTVKLRTELEHMFITTEEIEPAREDDVKTEDEKTTKAEVAAAKGGVMSPGAVKWGRNKK
jgi:hypothetical protein